MAVNLLPVGTRDENRAFFRRGQYLQRYRGSACCAGVGSVMMVSISDRRPARDTIDDAGISIAGFRIPETARAVPGDITPRGRVALNCGRTLPTTDGLEQGGAGDQRDGIKMVTENWR